MKTKFRSTSLLFSLLFAITLLFSCSKDGEDGAIGPQGPQGEQGPAGPQGEQGEQGDAGTANVIYSDWILVEYLNLAAASQNEMDLATLTANEFNFGTDLVLVFAGNNIFSDSFEVFQLPYIHNQNIVFGFGMLGDGDGSTKLQIQVSTLDGSNNSFGFIDYYRYIIIPGGVSSAGKTADQPDFSKMTYEEVIDHFHIPQ